MPWPRPIVAVAALATSAAVLTGAGSGAWAGGVPAPPGAPKGAPPETGGAPGGGARSGALSLTGGELCALVEGMPGEKDPARQRGPYAPGLRRLGRVGSDRRRAAAAYRSLTRATRRLLERAQATFHPRRGRVRQRAAQVFLRRYVLGPGAPLRIADETLAPRRSVAVATAWAACRAGHLDDALALARVRARDTPSLASFAALVLAARGQRGEAAELIPRMGAEGFLSVWVKAELAASPEARRAAHGRARRRVTTPAQAAALAAQARRYGLSEGREGTRP